MDHQHRDRRTRISPIPVTSTVIIASLVLFSSLSTAQQPGSDLPDGSLALDGGRWGGRAAGNVLVALGGRMRAVCDDGWDFKAATVACRSLGFAAAVRQTTNSHFGLPQFEVGLTGVRCLGSERSLLDCQHQTSVPTGQDCDRQKTAGVFCSEAQLSIPSPVFPSPPQPTETAGSGRRNSAAAAAARRVSATGDRPSRNRDGNVDAVPVVMETVMGRPRDAASAAAGTASRMVPAYALRIAGGPAAHEGRVEMSLDGLTWGVVCSDQWTLSEARVACRQAGQGLAAAAVKTSSYGGESMAKLAGGLSCTGEESRLSQCTHGQVASSPASPAAAAAGVASRAVACQRPDMVAGVVCATKLPDLVPNATLLQTSTYLHDQTMYYLQCALEENCAAPTAFTIKDTNADWQSAPRRLMRFSTSTWNYGTADFRPALSKDQWQWHQCHMHYHSMQVFANYDLLDERTGRRVADGHKASFCLEDVQCVPAATRKFACKGFGEQGISVGCADDYRHDIDCQWIDITDVPPGNYIFKVTVNPEYLVAELDYGNNAATCRLRYTGSEVTVTNCVIGGI